MSLVITITLSYLLLYSEYKISIVFWTATVFRVRFQRNHSESSFDERDYGIQYHYFFSNYEYLVLLRYIRTYVLEYIHIITNTGSTTCTRVLISAKGQSSLTFIEKCSSLASRVVLSSSSRVEKRE